MNDSVQLSERLASLERRQGRTSRRLWLLGAIVLLQAAVIAYLAVPFGGAAKHPVALQAGRFEVVDRNGVVRAELTADIGQAMLALHDSAGRSQVLLRGNESGFATMEFFDRGSGEKTTTLFAGSKRSFLELRDPATWRRLSIQAGEGEMGLSRLDERGQALP